VRLPASLEPLLLLVAAGIETRRTESKVGNMAPPAARAGW
jgi:hypothetical protein